MAADPLRTIAAHLGSIASTMADEAAALTQVMREAGEHVRDIAALAADLDAAAGAVEENVQSQMKLLARAHAAAAGNEPVMAALAGTAQAIATMATLVGEIAGRSRLLALNARIEAARSDGDGRGFAVVATEMTDLAGQTRTATDEIGASAATIGSHVEAAHAAMTAGAQLVGAEQRLIGSIAETTERQRAAASHVAALTAETVARVEDAATGIGRVASAASAVGLLARQLTRAADRGGMAISPAPSAIA